ncbi:MAG: RagB/SusD family nutrient uptake outer membrane protein [Chloroherpetonaceae bacterium]|nr:RagB/SusD family nutrient uptake outer membrane protein [Chloroherpetonaceae bacterium]
MFTLRRYLSILVIAVTLVVGSGCADLNVENPNNPDVERVLATTNDLLGVQQGALIALFTPHATGPSGFSSNVNLEWTADYVTMTNNVNTWWSQFKAEPRPQFNNTVANGSLAVFSGPYSRWYAAISASNDVIRAIAVQQRSLSTAADTRALLATAYFVRAMAFGYLANVFDKAVIVDLNTDVSNPSLPFASYSQVMTFAQRSFDLADSVCNVSGGFTLPASFIPTTGGPYNAARFSRLINTYRANMQVQNSRNRSENDAQNWAQILNWVNKGLNTGEDFTITIDYINWGNNFQILAGLDWYWRVDHRVIRWIDPNYPKRFPNTIPQTNSLPPANGSADARLATYFRFESSFGSFNPTRGPQLRSHYRFGRFEDLFAADNDGTPFPSIFLYAETNRLLRAEALAMTGNVSGAIAILNDPSGRRKTEGNVADIPGTATREEVIQQIHRERDLELMFSDYGLHFMDMRRFELLQKGTILHFPVPVTQLNIMQVPNYTFGGQTPTAEQATGTATDTTKAWIRPSEQNIVARPL